MNRIIVLLSVLFIAATGCPPTPTPPDAGPPTTFDAKHTSTCESAWQRMVDLKCEPDSGTWLDACKNAALHGIDLHTDCRTKAVDCGAVQKCNK